MVIAVTGANGHVGSNLCRMLLREGHRVKALVYKDDRGIKDLDLEKVTGDILDRPALDELFDGADVVFHLAAIISIKGSRNKHLEKVNVEGTRNIIESLKDSSVKRLVHFSSIHALVNSPVNEPMDETRSLATTNPLPYERTKSAGEKMVREAARNGIDAVVINPTSIIGPNDYKPSLVGQLLIRLYNRQIPALVPGGYNWVDVRDVCQGAINAMEKGKSGEGYLLPGHWLSLSELSATLSQIVQRPTPTLTIPFWLARIGVPFIGAYYSMLDQHPLYTSASLDIIRTGSRKIVGEKARKDLGYNSRPIEDTLKDTMEFFKKEHFIR